MGSFIKSILEYIVEPIKSFLGDENEYLNMQLFTNKIHLLKNTQLSNIIIIIIQNSKVEQSNFLNSVNSFGLIIDLLCSEGIVKMNESEKKSICWETMQRLPLKMFMETDSVELESLLDMIVRDVLLGDVLNENVEIRTIMEKKISSVTFSRYIDVGELTRQISRLGNLFIEKNIVDKKTSDLVMNHISKKIFFNLHCIRKINTNCRDTEKIVGSTIANIIQESIIYHFSTEITNIGDIHYGKNEFCLVWIGICDVYNTQYKLKNYNVSACDKNQMVQKMLLAKSEMRKRIELFGEKETNIRVRAIFKSVCSILSEKIEILKMKKNISDLEELAYICPGIQEQNCQRKMAIHKQSSKGIHLLQNRRIDNIISMHESSMHVPASIYEVYRNKKKILEDELDESTDIIISWTRKNIMISFMHILWSLFG